MKNHTEITVSIIGIVITVIGAVVGVMQYRIDAINDKVQVHVEAMKLEIERTRDWLDKVSTRTFQAGKETEQIAKAVTAIDVRLERMTFIVEELMKEKREQPERRQLPER